MTEGEKLARTDPRASPVSRRQSRLAQRGVQVRRKCCGRSRRRRKPQEENRDPEKGEEQLIFHDGRRQVEVVPK